MMRAVLAIAAVGAALTALPALAQTPPPDAQAAMRPPTAIELESPEAAAEAAAKEPSGLTPGANSFAEGQAKALIESKGYNNVSALVNDRKGIWHGTATKGQAKVQVSVDYKGNVDAK